MALLLTSCAAIPKDVSVGVDEEIVIHVHYNKPIGEEYGDQEQSSRNIH